MKTKGVYILCCVRITRLIMLFQLYCRPANSYSEHCNKGKWKGLNRGRGTSYTTFTTVDKAELAEQTKI